MEAFQGKPIVWITLINYGYVNYTLNFIESMKRHDCVFPFIVYCMDQESMNALSKIPNVLCLSALPFIRCMMNKNMTSWNTIDYKRIVFSKLDAIKYSLELFKTSSIGYIDTDIVLFKDPTSTMLSALAEFPEARVISQCDENCLNCTNRRRCPNICTGVIVFRQGIESIRLCRYTEKDIQTNYTDQHCLLKSLNNLNIKYITISKHVFINGAIPGLKDGKIDLPNSAVLLHFNYMSGNLKEYYMNANKMWYLGYHDRR